MNQTLQTNSPKSKENSTKPAATAANGNGLASIGEPSPRLLETYRRAVVNHAKTLFDYLKEHGSANEFDLQNALPEAIPLVAFEAAIDFLQDKCLVEFSARTQTYSLSIGAEWFEEDKKTEESVAANLDPEIQLFNFLKDTGRTNLKGLLAHELALFGKRLGAQGITEITLKLEEKGLIRYFAETSSYEAVPDAVLTKTDSVVSEEEVLPPIDLELYESEVIANGGEILDDEDEQFTPEEVRDQYFGEALAVAAKIRQLEANLDSFNTKTKKGQKEKSEAEKFIKDQTAALGSYLVQSHNYFGAPSAKYLERRLNEFGFTFDENFKVVLPSPSDQTEQPNDAQVFDEKLAQIESAYTDAKIKRNAALWKYLTEGETTELSLAYSKALEKYATAEGNLRKYRVEKNLSESLDYLQIASEQEIRERAGMEVKAKTASATAPDNLSEKVDISSTNGKAADANVSAETFVRLVSPSLLNPSPTNPRKRLDLAALDELADSLKQHGFIQPITVRPNGSPESFEIVCGERRYRAALKAELKEVPVIVKNLTDEQVLDLQIQENLQRQDVHPLDEALGYEHLQKTLNIGISELALRVGRSEKYVVNRLKLNDLTDEIKELLSKDVLPVGHALEISKYPAEIQTEILSFCFGTTWVPGQGHVPDAAKPKPLRSVVEQIGEKILLNLKQAPFSTKATNLRADGLACVECPQRTGAETLLFAELNEAKADCCLNKICYEGKRARHIELQRAAASEEYQAQTGKKNYKAPLISESWYLSDDAPKGTLDRHYYKALDAKEKCDKAETGIFVDGSRIGQKQLVCRDLTCKKHFSSSTCSSSKTSDPEEDRAKRLERKQEIFDVKVGEKTRRLALREIASKFDASNTILSQENFEKYEIRLVSRMWKLLRYDDDRTAKVIAEALDLSKDEINIDSYSWNSPEDSELISKLSPDVRSRLLFLMLYAHECQLYPEHNDSWNDQNLVINLAEEFGVDYQLIDAKARFDETLENKTYKKFQYATQDYYVRVKKGEKDAEKPVFFKVETAKEAANGKK
ncbi:MAG: ParB/RepB/Spo0J family partition protein [Acidobacteriota bacterium]|nr:ParB/RepB/Spo0J family partition protein [Acidobacteriota bacterium]